MKCHIQGIALADDQGIKSHDSGESLYKKRREVIGFVVRKEGLEELEG